MLVVLIVPVKTIGARGFPVPELSRRSPRLSSLSAGILTMTPLRQRFIEDLQLRNRSPKTIEVYVYHGREVARHFKQSTVSLFQFPVCAVQRLSIFSGCNSRPATGSLQPVAIGAAVEATRPPEPSMQRVAQATPRAGRP